MVAPVKDVCHGPGLGETEQIIQAQRTLFAVVCNIFFEYDVDIAFDFVIHVNGGDAGQTVFGEVVLFGVAVLLKGRVRFVV